MPQIEEIDSSPLPERSEEPKPTPSTSLPLQLVGLVKALLLDRQYFWHLFGLLFVWEVVLCAAIIRFVPYTNIDWTAYMQQVHSFLYSGERDYSKIAGDTGPLVYPALHLYLYSLLSLLLPSDSPILPTHGKHIPAYPTSAPSAAVMVTSPQLKAAQYVFAAVYLVNIGLVGWIYWLAGAPGTTKPGMKRGIHLPQLLLIPMTLSKRIHSIYMLRMFNDPIAMMFLYGAVVLMMKNRWTVGCVVFSLALGVKMNILLFLPGLPVLLFQSQGLRKTLGLVLLIAGIQIVLPLPYFFASPELVKSYFAAAFDFSRAFEFKWSVNWKWAGERRFGSQEFSSTLLAGHLISLVLFGWFSWSSIVPGGTLTVLRKGLSNWSQPPVPSFEPFHIPFVLFTSNLIGIVFARSLHYQFYIWYFHQIPFLLWTGWVGSGADPVRLLISGMAYVATEVAWNSFPPSIKASKGLLLANLMMLLGVWGTTEREGGGLAGGGRVGRGKVKTG